MNKLLLLLLALTVFGCTGSKITTLATQGELSQATFNREMAFDYLGQHIFIEVQIRDQAYTFLLDTGYDLSMVDQSLLDQLDFQPLQKHSTSGSSFEAKKLQYGTLASLEIAGLAFQNIGVGIQDLAFIHSPFADQRKIAGIIGMNVLGKAHWQFDYQRQKIRFSNRLANFPLAAKVHKIPLVPKSSAGWGYRRIEVLVDGVVGQFIFDTGAGQGFVVNGSFLEKLKVGDLSGTEQGKYPAKRLELGGLVLDDVEMVIDPKAGLLMGNGFWENYILTVDWKENVLYLEAVGE